MSLFKKGPYLRPAARASASPPPRLSYKKVPCNSGLGGLGGLGVLGWLGGRYGRGARPASSIV